MKTNLLFIGIFFMSTYAFGQNAVGGKIGINLATWHGDLEELDIEEDLDRKLGLQIGGVFEIGISNLLSIQPEFIFIQKGVREEVEYEFFEETIKAENSLVLNYLELPILLKLKFGDQAKTNFFVTAGPSFGYAASGKSKSKITIENETETDSEKIEFDEDDGFRRFELSASLGAGVNIPAGPGNIFIEARYLLGLSNLNDEEGEDLKVKNGSIGLSVGYMVPLGK